MSEYDPTFVRVLTYICPVPYQTYVCPYFIKTKSRFTKQVCPAPCQIGRRQQFGPEHCRIQNTVPTWRHSVRPDTIRSESSVYNHQLTQPLHATHHISRTEFRTQCPLGGTVFGLTRSEMKAQSTTISLHSPCKPHTISEEQNSS